MLSVWAYVRMYVPYEYVRMYVPYEYVRMYVPYVRMYVCMCNEVLHLLLLAVVVAYGVQVCEFLLCCVRVCCALASAGEKGEQGIEGVPGRKGMPVGHVTVM